MQLLHSANCSDAAGGVELPVILAFVHVSQAILRLLLKAVLACLGPWVVLGSLAVGGPGACDEVTALAANGWVAAPASVGTDLSSPAMDNRFLAAHLDSYESPPGGVTRTGPRPTIWPPTGHRNVHRRGSRAPLSGNGLPVSAHCTAGER